MSILDVLAGPGTTCGPSAGKRATVHARALVRAVLRRATLAGFPDRLARRRAPRSLALSLAGGGTATLDPTSAVREVDRVRREECVEGPLHDRIRREAEGGSPSAAHAHASCRPTVETRSITLRQGVHPGRLGRLVRRGLRPRTPPRPHLDPEPRLVSHHRPHSPVPPLDDRTRPAYDQARCVASPWPSVRW